jgi:hypothetical protein
MDSVDDPAGTFYRYSLPMSFMFKRTNFNGEE